MSQCPYFHIWRKTLESQSISGRRDAPLAQQIKAPYCDHPESPAPFELVTGAIGGGKILKCGGAVANCQLPGGLKPDID